MRREGLVLVLALALALAAGGASGDEAPLPLRADPARLAALTPLCGRSCARTRSSTSDS